MKMLDYISILAGGKCYTGCEFCVGNHIRKDEPPHFANEQMFDFIKSYQGQARELSISGSTSDPLYCDYELLTDLIYKAKDLKYFVSLHTSVLNKKTVTLYDTVNELCLSIHDIDKKTCDFVNQFETERIRISSVCTENNKSIYESGEFFSLLNSTKFTIRLNIHEPNLNVTLLFNPHGRIYNQKAFKSDSEFITLWNFKDANKHIKALYLWPNGEIKRQCFWDTVLEKLN